MSTTGRRGNGEGTITAHRDGYQGRIRVVDPVTGAQRRVSVYGRSRREVRDKMREVGQRSATGHALTDTRGTLGAHLDRWVGTTLEASPRRATTKQTYATLLRVHVIPTFGDVRLDRLRPSHVEQLVLAMRGRGLAPATIRQTYTVLRLALDAAVRDGLLVSNPAAKVDRPGVPRRAAEVLTVEQVGALLSASEGERLRPLLVLLVATALRRGEALALRWSDVDLDAHSLRVSQTLVRVGGELRMQPPKTDRGWRAIPLAPAVVAELRALRQSQLEDKVRYRMVWQDSDLVFTTELGTPIDPRNALRWYKRIAAKAGVGHTSLHTLRHTAATLLLADGANIRLVADVLGHSSVAITGDVYAHVLDEQRTSVMHGLADRIRLSAGSR